MKKLVLLLVAALALPVIAQNVATKSEAMRSVADREKATKITPLPAWNASTPRVFTENTREGKILWDFESDASFEGWLSYDADGDGYGWEVDDYYSYAGGGYSLTSRSYYGGTALTPDNWLISPEVNLEGTLSIFAMNYLSYYPDNMQVYVCVGEVDFDNIDQCFVPISEMITPPNAWTEYTYDLSSYGGAVGCFAIRHYDCTDMFRLLVDYISIGTDVPMPTTPEDVAVEPGQDSGAVLWTDEDDSEWCLRYRVYTPQPEATGFFEDFEACQNNLLPEGWSTIDADGDNYNWFVWDPIAAGYDDPGDGIRLNGTKCATSASYVSAALYPDNWLITPKVTLTGSLSFFAAGQDPSYSAEVFAVYVSTDGENWEKLSEDITATSPIQQYTFDLSEYEGMEGYIAFRHYNISDMFRLNIDDVLIGEIPEPVEEAEWIYVDGITSTDYLITGLDPATTYEVQVQAVNEYGESDWSPSCIFTTKTKTSVNEIVTEVKGDNIYYNLMGQKMDPANLPAGIYIHNGKKVLVK